MKSKLLNLTILQFKLWGMLQLLLAKQPLNLFERNQNKVLKMIRDAFMILFAVLLHPGYTHACSCGGPLDFCATLNQNNPDLVVLAVKTANQAHGMQIEILEILKGAESRQQVVVWGDNGLLCRHYTSQWNLGDTLIYAIDLIGSSPALPQEDSTDYQISICGIYVLHFSGGMVSGAINGVDTTMSYADFKNLLPSCGATSVLPGEDFPKLQLYPNPAHGLVQISLPYSFTTETQMRLFAIDGKEIKLADKIFATESPKIVLQTQTLPAGIYILEVRLEELAVRRKLVVQ